MSFSGKALGYMAKRSILPYALLKIEQYLACQEKEFSSIGHMKFLFIERMVKGDVLNLIIKVPYLGQLRVSVIWEYYQRI